MEKAVIGFNSGQMRRYSHDVVPLERKLHRNNAVNWFICLLILLLAATGGIVAGFFFLPNMLGIFVGLLGGSVAGLLILPLYYFLRSSVLNRTKKKAVNGVSSCESAYANAYQIPKEAAQCNILASDFLSKNYFEQSLIYVREDKSISIVAPDYKHERDEIRYSPNSVIAYALFSDSRVLVQSQEGYVILSSQAKDVFVSSDLPLLGVESRYRFDISGTALRAYEKSMDRIEENQTPENASWEATSRALSTFLEKEDA